MKQNHLFLLDPIEKLNLKLDSSLRMAYSLADLGHQIYFSHPAQLRWKNSSPYADLSASQINFRGGPENPEISAAKTREVGEFDCIHMRRDPPFDMSYVASTWLLDAVPSKTKVINSPEMLRNFNEKLGTFHFSKWMLPSCVGANSLELLNFVKELDTDFIIAKPLDLFGGHGVKKLSKKNLGELGKTLESLTQNDSNPIMVQSFDPNISLGEVRAFTAGGEIISWCKKIPAAGEFLANTRAGARLDAHQPTPRQEEAVKEIAKKLHASGVFLTGIDLIADHVSEINITSPRLLVAPGDNTNYYHKIALLIEDYCKKFDTTLTCSD